MKHALRRFIGMSIAATLITGCGSSIKLSAPPDFKTPLAVSSCPELTPLVDKTFGGTTNKLVEVAGIYYECRAAALAKP